MLMPSSKSVVHMNTLQYSLLIIVVALVIYILITSLQLIATTMMEIARVLSTVVVLIS